MCVRGSGCRGSLTPMTLNGTPLGEVTISLTSSMGGAARL